MWAHEWVYRLESLTAPVQFRPTSPGACHHRCAEWFLCVHQFPDWIASLALPWAATNSRPECAESRAHALPMLDWFQRWVDLPPRHRRPFSWSRQILRRASLLLHRYAFDLDVLCGYSSVFWALDFQQRVAQSFDWSPAAAAGFLQLRSSWCRSCIQTWPSISCLHQLLYLFHPWAHQLVLYKAWPVAHFFSLFNIETAIICAHYARTWKQPSNHLHCHVALHYHSSDYWPSLEWTIDRMSQTATDCALATASAPPWEPYQSDSLSFSVVWALSVNSSASAPTWEHIKLFTRVDLHFQLWCGLHRSSTYQRLSATLRSFGRPLISVYFTELVSCQHLMVYSTWIGFFSWRMEQLMQYCDHRWMERQKLAAGGF